MRSPGKSEPQTQVTTALEELESQKPGHLQVVLLLARVSLEVKGWPFAKCGLTVLITSIRMPKLHNFPTSFLKC